MEGVADLGVQVYAVHDHQHRWVDVGEEFEGLGAAPLAPVIVDYRAVFVEQRRKTGIGGP